MHRTICIYIYIYYTHIYPMTVCPCILWVNVDLLLHCLRVRVAADMLHHFHLMVICLVNTHYKAIDIPGLPVILSLWLRSILKYDNGSCTYMNFGYIELHMNISSYRNSWWDEVCIACIFKKETWFRKRSEYLNRSYNCILHCFHNSILTFKFLSISFSKKC